MQQEEILLTTRREEDTASVGEVLGSIISKPLTVALQGDLGAGKTVFVRGAALGLGVREQVSSPTFVLLKIYKGRLPLYHFDFYRLGAESEDELCGLGFEEYLPGEGVAFVEWAQRLPSLLPQDHLLVKIETFHDQEGEGRRINLISAGLTALEVVNKLAGLITIKSDGSLTG